MAKGEGSNENSLSILRILNSLTLDILVSILSKGKGATNLNLLKGPLMSSYGSEIGGNSAEIKYNISLPLEIKLFNACVKSVLLYGCELQAFVNRCLRNILGIWWPQIISNKELSERTGQSKIDVEIK
jgi:hypothetical protein